MKTKIFTHALVALLFSTSIFAQNRTTVTATGSEISDNLDLRAVASIFGDSQNLEDFEQRLNDPKAQISNLDLNGDNQVDYLRVIESVEGYTHLVIVQAVLDRDVFQDVATIEVEKNNNQVQVQVVGNVFMYGQNYIYEPVYVNRPIIYNHFWITNYRPYVSNWYWNYYPRYYYAWTPYPVFRYRKNIHVHINIHNHYNYVNTRRSQTAVALYGTRRSNGYERQYPDRAFERRNAQVANRYELDKTRTSSIRQNDYTTRNNTTRSNVESTTIKREANIGTRVNSDKVRTNSNIQSANINRAINTDTKSNTGRIKTNSGVRTQQATRLNTASNSQISRDHSTIKSQNPVRQQNSQIISRGNNTRDASTAVRTQTATPRQSSVRTQPATSSRNITTQSASRVENSESRNSSSRR